MSKYCDPDYFCNCDDCVDRRGFDVCRFCGVDAREEHDEDCVLGDDDEQ